MILINKFITVFEPVSQQKSLRPNMYVGYRIYLVGSSTLAAVMVWNRSLNLCTGPCLLDGKKQPFRYSIPGEPDKLAALVSCGGA